MYITLTCFSPDSRFIFKYNVILIANNCKSELAKAEHSLIACCLPRQQQIDQVLVLSSALRRSGLVRTPRAAAKTPPCLLRAASPISPTRHRGGGYSAIDHEIRQYAFQTFINLPSRAIHAVVPCNGNVAGWLSRGEQPWVRWRGIQIGRADSRIMSHSDGVSYLLLIPHTSEGTASNQLHAQGRRACMRHKLLSEANPLNPNDTVINEQ